ncbi:secretion protein HlyD [Halieaceae bacterium IMCC14734]|uniref:Secretion protein HlyD n=1 Tax=Candidatus Litorirhabdus singularis TaxID=2518993 RepID=A0ABT3TFB7_9GAMM|nr:secretion protein HlyD [Candidatus Litorirhabdus singularis]MCX2981008.1 secretion protein HlyD [Candidatus Litorirhabdus singularis]
MKKLIPVVVVVLLGLLLLVSYEHWFGEGDSNDLVLYGNVDIRQVQPAFRVSGRVQAMYFEEGDAVQAGDLLAQLDPLPLQQALAVTVAREDQSRAQLERLQHGSRTQEIEQARALTEKAEAALEDAELELQRQRKLVVQKMSSQRTLDRTLSMRDQSAAQLQANREALALAVEGSRMEDIAAAQAALAMASAQREQAVTQVDDTRLVAPSKGIVMSRIHEPGAMVMAGTPVYALSLTETVYVRAYVDEPRLGLVKPGASVRVTSDSSGVKYQGQVGFISPRAEFTPKNVETTALRTDLVYRLRIVVTDTDNGLRQGMPVTVLLD